MVDQLLAKGADIMLAAENGRLYPLYSAEKVGKFRIFARLSKEDPPGGEIYNVPTPERDGKGVQIPLAVMLKNTANVSDDAAIQSDINPFFLVYQRRTDSEWSRETPLVDAEYEELQNKFCIAVADGDLVKAGSIKQELVDTLGGVDDNWRRSILEEAVDQHNNAMLRYLLENGVQYRRTNLDSSIFEYALFSIASSPDTKAAIGTLKWMLDNHQRFSSQINLDRGVRGGRASWRAIIENAAIQNQENAWAWIEEMLSIYRNIPYYHFRSEDVFSLCGKDYQFSREIFEKFNYLITAPININDEPLSSYFLKQGFFHGVDAILGNESLCRILDIGAQYNHLSLEKFIDLLNMKLAVEDDPENERYQRYLELYEKMYPPWRPRSQPQDTAAQQQ
jgi:hypothetical protein